MGAHCDSFAWQWPYHCHNNAASVWVLRPSSAKIKSWHEYTGSCRVRSWSGAPHAGVVGGTAAPGLLSLRGDNMAAMKPRTGDGPLEVTKEGRGIVMRVPLEGGGRLV